MPPLIVEPWRCVLRFVSRLMSSAMPSLVCEVGTLAPVVPVHSPAAPAPSPAIFIRPKSKSGWKNRATIGAAQISTVRFVFEETVPFGRFKYAEMEASGWSEFVVPGSRMRTPLSVAPFPRTCSGTAEIVSVNEVPFVAAPAAWLKDQRFTSAACAEAARTMKRKRMREFI